MIYFELIFLSDVKLSIEFLSVFVLLMAAQFFQYHLLTIIVSTLNLLGDFVKNKLTMYVWVNFWTPNSFPCVYLYVCLDTNSTDYCSSVISNSHYKVNDRTL